MVERFKNLGVCATRANVTAALAELGLQLELSSWAPWRLPERGTEWILEPKSEVLELLSGVRRLPLKEAKILSEEHQAVLLVVIGYRQKGGVSKTRVGEILGLETSFYLDDLLSQGLVYCDPSRELNFWRPTPSALLALGLRSHTDIPALKELEEVIETNLNACFLLSKFAAQSMVKQRQVERRGTLGEFALEPDPPHLGVDPNSRVTSRHLNLSNSADRRCRVPTAIMSQPLCPKPIHSKPKQSDALGRWN